MAWALQRIEKKSQQPEKPTTGMISVKRVRKRWICVFDIWIRNNSEDSRYANIGNVKRDYIIGKAWFRFSGLGSFGTIK